ncbi:MAG: hypothetical protein U0Y68_07745 [Blastocatellia bacterium]
MKSSSAKRWRELAGKIEDAVIVRIEKPTAIPVESLHGRKDEAGITLRSTVRQILPAAALGEFSLQPQQGAVRASLFHSTLTATTGTR